MASSSPNFRSVFNAALREYNAKTKTDLLAHPLAAQLRMCDSSHAILTVLRDQVQELDQGRNSNERFTRWLNPTVNILYAFSATLGEGVGLAFSPAKAIFAGIGVLLLAAKDLNANKSMLVDLFERIESFLIRLESYTEMPLTGAMTNIVLKVMVEVLSILAIATKEIKRGLATQYANKLVGRADIGGALKRLDKLTQEEARMVTAEVLTGTRRVEDDVKELIGDSKEVKECMQQTAEQVAVTMQQTTNDIIDAISTLRPEGPNVLTGRQLRQAFRRWLSPPDPSINHKIAREAYHESTAAWFFQGTLFKEWKSTPSLLWVHGIPGSGKSVLCSSIVQHVMDLRNEGLASMGYFYFDFRDENKRSRDKLLRSLLVQLSDQSDLCSDILSRLYSAHDDGKQQPSDPVLTRCLKDMLSLPVQNPVYLIVDAVDECPDNSGMPTAREQVLGLIKDVVNLRLPNLRLCMTSRPEGDIQTTLEPLKPLSLSLHQENGQKQDIVEYVKTVVYSDPKMRRWREKDRRLVVETLSQKADGMFRWVYCQLEALRHCLPSSVQRVLQELPKNLDDTYERVLRDMNDANREQAHHLLQCLTVSARPLRVEELAEVLAVDFDSVRREGIPNVNPDWRWEDQDQAILSTCSSLIVIVDDGGSQIVQFSHFTVKEFLTSTRLADARRGVSYFHILLKPAHATLAQACLGVLLRLDNRVDESNIGDFCLAEYAVLHWLDHVRFENASSDIRDAIEYFLDADKPHWEAWYRVRDKVQAQRASTDARPTPLYYAALCGLDDVVKRLVARHPQHVNVAGHLEHVPLAAALGEKHFPVAQLLHRLGADVNIWGFYRRTLLHNTFLHGDVDIAQWLLGHGVDVNARDDDGETPLHQAAKGGHPDLVRILIGHKAKINSRDDEGRTPLHLAADNGHFDVIRVLIERKAKINSEDDKGQTPLHIAANNGHLDVVQVLIEHKVKIAARDNSHHTPLHLAVRWGRLDVVRMLLQHNANVNARDSSGSAALHIGSDPWNTDNQLDIMQLLLENITNANARHNGGSTSRRKLSSGQWRWYNKLSKSPVENINAKNNMGRTALEIASEKGYREIVELLRGHGAR